MNGEQSVSVEASVDPVLAAAASTELQSAPRAPRSWGSWLKPAALVLVVGGVIAVVPATPLGRYLDYEAFQGLVASAGVWAPLLFVLALTLGAVFVAPGSFIAFAGAAVFGGPAAMLLVTIGVNLGANAAFLLGRWAGRDFVESRLSRSRGWFARIDAALARNGFFAILFLRAVFAPYNILNYVAAFTHIRWRDYALGTALGMLPVVFVWVALGDALGRVWETGDLTPLVSPSGIVAGVVFLVCIAVPLAVRRWRAGRGATSAGA